MARHKFDQSATSILVDQIANSGSKLFWWKNLKEEVKSSVLDIEFWSRVSLAQSNLFFGHRRNPGLKKRMKWIPRDIRCQIYFGILQTDFGQWLLNGIYPTCSLLPLDTVESV